MANIGERIKAVRGTVTQRKLAAAAGISPSTLGNIERGDTEEPDPETLWCIAEVFGIEVAALLDPNGPKDLPIVARAVVPTSELTVRIRLSTRDTLAFQAAVETRSLEELAAGVLDDWALGLRRKSAKVKAGAELIAAAREPE